LTWSLLRNMASTQMKSLFPWLLMPSDLCSS
jgi:hypothetical protein